jgi:uncharacterized protein YdhG (YjbR/CyaY superfamily)
MSAVAKSVDEYLAALPKVQRDALERLRDMIKSVVPDADEVIRSRVPAFRYNDRPLVSLGASKRHFSLFIMKGNAIQKFKEELKAFDTSNTVVRFDPERPLPRRLVTILVKACIGEIEEERR